MLLKQWFFDRIFPKLFHTNLCRRLGVLEGMGSCPIAISSMTMIRTLNFVVLCTGKQT